MIIYYIYLLIFCIGSFIEKINIKLGKNIFNVLIFSLIIFLGIRYEVGNDYKTYYTNYLGINYGSGMVSAKEPLYILANYIFSFEIFIFLFGFLSIFLLKKVILYFTPPKFLITALLIYFGLYLVIFNVHLIRQGLAVSIVFYSYIFAYKSNYKKYIFL